jgi:hypothetical protein
MAKKIKIPAQDIIDVILSRKDEIVKAVNPEPVKVLELRERDGVTYSRYLCGHCKEEFNDFYAEEVSTGYYRYSETHYYCPFCRKEVSNSKKLFNDNKMDSEAFIAIQVDRKIYFAEAIISFEYNDALNVINTDFSFKALSVFNLDTNDKSSYKLKETNEFVYTTAMLTSLLCYCGIWYSDEAKRPKFMDVTESELSGEDFFSVCRQLDRRKKKTVEKKEVVLPIELDDDPPLPALTDCINITVTEQENDRLEETTTYKAHCLHCHKEWFFNVNDYNDDYSYNSNFLAECPYCGASQQVKRSTYRSGGGHYNQTWIYISDNSYEATVKVVSVFIEKNTLHPKVQAALSGYYVFNQKGVCNGFLRHVDIDMSSRSLFSGAKEYSFCCAPWYTAKFDAKYAETPLHKVICNLSDDGILKYSGLKEFINQQPRRRLGYNSGTGAMTTRELFMFINKTLKYPVAEKLAKEGFANEILDADKTAIRKNTNDTAVTINWKAKTAAEAFGITPALLKYYKSAKKELGCDITMQTLQRLHEIDNDIIGEDAFWCDRHGVPIESIVKIQKVLPTLSVSKITSYLERVRIGQMFDPVPAAEQWRDYLDACKSIDMDMTDRHVLYPRALKTEHDIVMSKQKFIADEALNDDFVKSVDKYRFLEYHKDDYFIKVPESMQSMFEEGRKLNHCCGRYVDDVIDKQAFILFLRRKDNPDTPFLSIEVSPDMTVHQVRGVNDTYVSVQKDSKAINIFLQSWARMKHLCLDIR